MLCGRPDVNVNDGYRETKLNCWVAPLGRELSATFRIEPAIRINAPYKSISLAMMLRWISLVPPPTMACLASLK